MYGLGQGGQPLPTHTHLESKLRGALQGDNHAHSLDDLDHRLVLIEDKKFNCCQDNEQVNHQLMEQETLLQAVVIRIGELEHQLDTVCRNVSVRTTSAEESSSEGLRRVAQKTSQAMTRE